MTVSCVISALALYTSLCNAQQHQKNGIIKKCQQGYYFDIYFREKDLPNRYTDKKKLNEGKKQSLNFSPNRKKERPTSLSKWERKIADN